MILSHLVILLVLAVACAPVAPARPPAGDPSTRSSSENSTLPARLVLSVLYFEDRTGLPELAWVRKGLTDMLITDLSQASNIRVVQRERLEELVREQTLQAAGRVEEKTAVRIGRLTGATIMLLGSATRAGSVLRLDAHLLDVERGTIVGAAAVEGQPEEVLSLEKQLAAKVLTLLHLDGFTERSAETTSRDAAEALYQGLDAADRGDLTEALGKFETALKRDERYADARRRYERTLHRVDRGTLWSRILSPDGSADDRARVGARLADDLFSEGLLAEIVTRIEAGDLTSSTGLRIRFSPDAVRRLKQEVQQLGGTVTEEATGLTLRIDQPEIHTAFVQAAKLPRRLFLHLEGADGQPWATYSRLQGWLGTQWIFLETQGVSLRPPWAATATQPLPRWLFDGAPSSLQAWLSFDPVPREQAVLQVELVGSTEDGREILLAPRPAGQGLPQIRRLSDAALQVIDELRLRLEEEIVRLWDPPVWERLPGPGYLPSARRSVMLTAGVKAGRLSAAQLISSSGDEQADTACLSAATQTDEKRIRPLLQMLESNGVGPMRLRIHCDLLQDVPSLYSDVRSSAGDPGAGK
jgi:TolB-like protein